MAFRPLEIKDLVKVFKFGLNTCGIVVLTIITLFWSIKALNKYLSEPVFTNIVFENGDSEAGIQFPIITLCESDPHYTTIFKQECGLKFSGPCFESSYHDRNNSICNDKLNNEDCNFDGGDCCLDQNSEKCLEDSRQFNRSYKGIKSFVDDIKTLEHM